MHRLKEAVSSDFGPGPVPLSCLRAALRSLGSPLAPEGGASEAAGDGAENVEQQGRASSSVAAGRQAAAGGGALLGLLAAQHLEELEAFGDEVAAVLELEQSRTATTNATTAVATAPAGIEQPEATASHGATDPAQADIRASVASSAEGAAQQGAMSRLPVSSLAAALQAVMPREEALRCLEQATGLQLHLPPPPLSQQQPAAAGHSGAAEGGAAVEEEEEAEETHSSSVQLDVLQLLRRMRAGCLLRPQGSRDLPGALAWARSRGGG